jgi:hypothetical protein
MKQNMKLIVVNDCSNVLSDIVPYFEDDIDPIFIRHGRGLWSKTFGLAWKIIRSEGDLYHCNYALQDSYLVSKLKHLDVLHVHGSDVRWIINSKKYGWIVKHNLHVAKKVLYATPDLESKVKSIREDAVYLPTPVDTTVFRLKQIYSEKPKAVYFKQWYENHLDIAVKLAKIRKHFDLTIQERDIAYCAMPYFLRGFDVFVDRFSIPSFSKTCLEAMSSGLATIDYRHFNGDLDKRLCELDLPGIYLDGMRNRSFVQSNHSVKLVADKLSSIYVELMK